MKIGFDIDGVLTDINVATLRIMDNLQETLGLQGFDLRLGDCLDVMASIPDNSVDAIIADPP